MDYMLLSLIPKRSFSILEYERIKDSINRMLVLEYVDDSSIFWDENGDLMFHPPVNKKDKGYWLNILNSLIDRNNWEFVSGKV
ncbi:MAG: hypothetical protein HUJ25_03660 [Crocinitomicaceae bacterium]|nr:hypothetical protein [Crocinitomicaceae bacterium]